jgi:hypothetical protein
LKNHHHGLGWYGSGKLFTSTASENIDGPVLYGWSGGALGADYYTTPGSDIKTVALRWTRDGKVGIGTLSPQASLDINGNLKVSSLSGAGNSVVKVNNNGELSIMAYADAGLGFWQTIGGDNIFHDFGNVGIGTNNPQDLLQVGNGYTSMISGSLNGSSALNFGTSYIGFNAARNISGNWNSNGDGAHNGGSAIFSTVFGEMYFASIPSSGTDSQTKTDAEVLAGTKLYISPNGDIAIGTLNTNGYKLSVNGNMRAKDIIVKTGWSDFVFEDDYVRMNVLEKEAFYKKEKHLPNITSGKEIETNGLQVGETMNGMMQNIEENTLDIADLYKRMLLLEKENSELKASIKSLIEKK